jgi:hypothetical protein
VSRGHVGVGELSTRVPDGVDVGEVVPDSRPHALDTTDSDGSSNT